MMDRRFFLKLTGFVAVAGALEEPLVEISGITNAQQISWSRGLAPQMASFTSFEYFDQPWRMPEIRVRGGQLEALAVVPIDLF